MSTPERQIPPATEREPSGLKGFLLELRKKRMIEILAGFVGGGWLIYEIVHWILVVHYHLPEKLLDITLITLVGTLLCTLIWRWFRGAEKRPGNVKVEVLLVPLIILITLTIDMNLILKITGIPGKKLLVAIITFLLGIAWIVFKSLQWAAITPESGIFPAPKWENSIAVLPFIDMSPQKDQEYFCDGMTEELINRLRNIRELRVPARTSVFILRNIQFYQFFKDAIFFG